MGKAKTKTAATARDAKALEIDFPVDLSGYVLAVVEDLGLSHERAETLLSRIEHLADPDLFAELLHDLASRVVEDAIQDILDLTEEELEEGDQETADLRDSLEETR